MGPLDCVEWSISASLPPPLEFVTFPLQSLNFGLVRLPKFIQIEKSQDYILPAIFPIQLVKNGFSFGPKSDHRSAENGFIQSRENNVDYFCPSNGYWENQGSVYQ